MTSSPFRYDKPVALAFFTLTIAFAVVAMTNDSFLNWAFERHQNQASWYIRPLFLIPYCFFAYKRSWTGISATVFALFTSMFWFAKPNVTSEQVRVFLQFEQTWLSGPWDVSKWLLTLTVPISFMALGLAWWKRSLVMGLTVLVLIAIAKIIWSVFNASDAGTSVIVPALFGLLLCVTVMYAGIRYLEKKKSQKTR